MPPDLLSKAPLPRALRRAPPALWRLGSGAALPAGPFVALVPGAEAPLLQLSLPPALKGAAREKVALRQAQDRLGAGPGALLMRPARLMGEADGWSAVLVAENARITGWRAQLAQATRGGRGGRCRAILPDYLALPAAPDLWTIKLDTAPGKEGAAMVRARLGPGDGFSAEPALAALMLARARAQAQGRGPRAVLRLGPKLAVLDAALEGLPLADSPAALPRGLVRPLVLGHGELALDLATDPAAEAQTLAARLRALRLPAALALAGLAGWAGGEWAETARLNSQADAMEAANIEMVRRDFLPSGPILDIPAQVSREIERRRAGAAPETESDTPLARLRRAAGVIALDPEDEEGGASDSAAMLQAVSWQAGSGLQLELVLADFAALDTLIADLRAAGLVAQVGQSAAEAGGRVAASIVIGEGQ
ncbi:MAG: hypothetical protein JJT95_04050 [Pararhodobacter sp.]|nr:hypothetical protein [Pararhodobacter sp.]